MGRGGGPLCLKIRPTLEFITLGLQPVIVYETLKD